jgi:hypothetical protein
MANLFLTPGDKLQLLTSATCSVDVIVFLTGGGRQAVTITTATTTDIFAGTASVDFILITNKHASTAVTVTPLFLVAGNATAFNLTGATVLAAGQALQFTGSGWAVPSTVGFSEIVKVISADDTGGLNVATAQPWFPTAGGVTLNALTTYIFDGQLALATGATTHTTGSLFGGTATITSIDYWAQIHSEANITITTSLSAIRVTVATVIVLNATSTAVETVLRVSGVVRINAGGTFIPQYQFSADPTGTITTRRNSYFRLRPLSGDNTVQSIGTWA